MTDLKYTVPIVFLCVLGACGNAVLQHTEMIGYEQGKKRIEYTAELFRTTLSAGGKGYRLETHIRYSRGIRDRLETIKTQYMKQDFTLDRVEKKRIHNEVVTETKFYLEGGNVVFWQKMGDEAPVEEKIPVEGKVFSELHPLLYAKELNQPGAEKSYPVFQESTREIRPLAVRQVGSQTVHEDGETYPAIHYQIQAAGRPPGEFHDYFVDPETKQIVKIDTGGLQFLPAK